MSREINRERNWGCGTEQQGTQRYRYVNVRDGMVGYAMHRENKVRGHKGMEL